jgi:hypothetical protein
MILLLSLLPVFFLVMLVVSSLAVLGLTIRAANHYKSQFQLDAAITGLHNDGKWSFKGWATPLISLAAGFNLILTLTQLQPAPVVTSISILCGAVLLLLPMAYTTFCEPAKRVRTFLIYAPLLLWAVMVELLAAAALADDKLVLGIPAFAVHVFRILMLVAAFIALEYYRKSSRQLLGEPAPAPASPAPIIRQLSPEPIM